MTKRTQNFISDIQTVYEKHNLSLSHEDTHGAFIIEEYKDENVKWLKQALTSTKYIIENMKQYNKYFSKLEDMINNKADKREVLHLAQALSDYREAKNIKLNDGSGKKA